MDNYWWCAMLFRILLPLVIAVVDDKIYEKILYLFGTNRYAPILVWKLNCWTFEVHNVIFWGIFKVRYFKNAIFIRPTITSYVYLVVGCYMPFFSVPTAKTMAGGTGSYMKILMITCIFTSTFALSFYFALFFTDEEEFDIKPCSTLEIALRTAGVIEFHGLKIVDAIPWCLPEPLMLITSTMLYLGFRHLCQAATGMNATTQMEEAVIAMERRKILSMFVGFGKYFLVFLLMFTAVLKPSILGAIYYMVFLTVMTYWACNQSLGKVFARILICLCPIQFFHMTIVFWYQFQYFQDEKTFIIDDLWKRLLKLVRIKIPQDCNDPRIFRFIAQSSSTYAMPVCLFFTYYLTVLISKEILQAKDGFVNLFIEFFRRENRSDVVRMWRKSIVKIRQKIQDDKVATASSVKADKIKMFVEQALQFIISIGYLMANFIMMVWAIAYVSWKTLILLMWACFIWLMPARKKVMLVSSPFLVAYVWFLLVVSYLYSMELSAHELTHYVGIFNFAEGIDRKSLERWVDQLTKSLFGIIIFVTMRQLWQERALAKQQKRLAEALELGLDPELMGEVEVDQFKSKFFERFQSGLLEFFAVWWIWLVIFGMIWMEFWTTSNVFRIAFVGLAFIFITTFQLCPFKWWKVFLRGFWWIVLVYAMINLLVFYMYQVPFTRDILHLYIAEEQFIRFGFRVWVKAKDLSLTLSTPILFQIAVVMQQNYLQDKFDKLTSPIPPEEFERREKERAQRDIKKRKLTLYIAKAKNVFIQVIKVHVRKFGLIAGWYMCVFDLCAIFVPFVLLFTAACVLGRGFRKFIIYFISVLVQIIILLRLLYMKLVDDHQKWNYVGEYTRNGKSFNKTLNTADWLGFHESRYGKDYADFGQLQYCFLYVLIVTLMRVVEIRIRNYRITRGLPLKSADVVFTDITYENCHKNTGTMFKFLANYGFYKFGYEITAIFAAILMSLRMDAVAIVMSFWLLLMFALSRRWMRVLWLPTMMISAVAVCLQYLTTLGFWPTYWDYTLTRFWSSNDFLLRIQQFCHLHNMAHPPAKEKITLDFCFLLLMSRQWLAFKTEWKLRGKYNPAGTNENVQHLLDEKNVDNPVPDFVTYTRSHLDDLKRIVFTGWFYLALICTFLAGTMRPTLYSFGYIIGAFVFVWEGTDLYLRPPSAILFRWNLLILYTILIMTFRTVSQIFGCILKYESHIEMNCNLYQIFTIGCVDKFKMTAGVPNVSKVSTCVVRYEALGLAYDCICFFFLIFQQRIFKSYHFFHIVNDAKAQNMLADRGALLIEDHRQKKRKAFDVQDAQIRDNIKKRMDKIRATHMRVQGEVYLRRKKNHRHILKSSDYYMFDEAGLSTDIPLMPEKQAKDYKMFSPYDPMSLTEYFALLYSSDIDAVLAERALRRKQKAALQEGKKPEDLRKALAVKDPKPGTSRATESETKLSRTARSLAIIIFIWGAFESCIVSLTGLLNYITRDFRSILDAMDRDKTLLKEKTTYAEGVRLGTNKIWHPNKSYRDILSALKGKDTGAQAIEYSIYLKLLRAIFHLLLSYSEWLCYFLIVFNQIIRANFIALPLVLITFCWGALTVPTPTKTYWIITIAYVLIMMFIKNFFVMDIIPWSTRVQKYSFFFPPTMIGLSRHTTVTFNLVLLMTFFFHRIVLQMLGLWEPVNYRTVSLIPDGEYAFKDGQLVPLAQNKAAPPLVVKSIEIPLGDYFPASVIHGFVKYAESFRLFMQQLISPSSTQIPVDVYTPMFICDLINIFIMMFCYGSFQHESQDQGIIEFIQNNTVPMSFIIVIVTYFLLMVIDRALYLKKNRFGKLIYHFFQVLICHVYFFFLYPLITERRFNRTLIVQIFYALKCLYFLLSAYQIRNGYPPLISCHFLWHNTTMLNRFGYKFYRIIPYFFEMRTLLDWICSDSVLGVNDWFKMEEITQNIFDQRCEQDFEENFALPAGEARNRTTKYLVGGCLYVLLILTVIFPFVLFSLGGTVGIVTHPNKVKIEVYMGGAEPIFQSYASEKNLKTLSESDFRNLTITFNNVVSSETIFLDFEAKDIVVVSWSPHSLTKWKVSPGTFAELMEDLLADEEFTFRVEISYTHIGHGGEKTERTLGQTVTIPPLPDMNRENLIAVMQSNKTEDTVVWLQMVFPKFLMITKDSTPRVLPVVGKRHSGGYEPIKNEDDNETFEADPKLYRNLLASLHHAENGEMWWQLKEECPLDDDDYYYYLKDLVHNKCDNLVMYTFNEKVFSETLNYLTQSGILGMYLLYFMMVIGVIRGCRIEIDEIWIEDLPDSDDMMRKCLEVYIARDMQNYELEEELFAELIFIMRSRETLIKLTRYEDTVYNPPLVGSKKLK